MLDEVKPTLWEQHAQSITAAITLAILIGAGTLLLSMRDDISMMKTELKFMSEKLNNAGDDRFRGADWRREKSILDERFFELRNTGREMEKRVEDVERKQERLRPAR